MAKLFVPVILGSTRRDRKSSRVAKFLTKVLAETEGVTTGILDLAEIDLPIMEERLAKLDDPPEGLVEFSETIESSDAVVIVSPEYNGGYPGVLKNALDYLHPEYRRKPFGIVTVSSGAMGGMSCLAQLRLVVLGLGGVAIPASMQVTRVGESFDEDGNPSDDVYRKRAERFVAELVWFADALATKRRAS